jgi:hypothetical protein
MLKARFCWRPPIHLAIADGVMVYWSGGVMELLDCGFGDSDCGL